jgi:hypothetical protein
MRRLSPRGFTLAGLLVALVLFGMIGLIITRILLGAERSLRALRGHADLQAAFDLGTGYLDAELADVGREPGVSDLLQVAPESLSYRATRGLGLACRVSATEVLVPRERLITQRAPQAGRDSLLLLVGSAAPDSASRWLASPVTSVGVSSCDAVAAIRLGTVLDTTGVVLPASPSLVPFRVFEVMQARLYASQGQWWLGARSESSGEGIQPLAGPFWATDSRFFLLDSAGGPTAAPRAVRSIMARLVGGRPGWGGGASVAAESVAARFSPGNLWP